LTYNKKSPPKGIFMPQPINSHIFISYSRKDEEVMRRVVAFLRTKELKVWVDNENLIPGTPVWEEEIENAIQRAYAVVAILSPDSERSEWVRREITYSDRYLKRVFPVLVGGDEDSSIPIRLITRQFVDIRSNEEVGLNSLGTAIAFYAEELEARERKAREEAEKLARAQAERDAAERESARLKAEREAVELAAHVAAEKAAKEKIEKEAAREKAAREKAAREKAEREKVEREAIKKSEHEAKEKETRARVEKRRQKYLELLNKTIQAIKLYYRRILLIAIGVTLIVLASIFALSLPLSTSTSTPRPTLPLSTSTSIPHPTGTSLLLSILSSPPGPTKTPIPTVSAPDESLQQSATWSILMSCQKAASGILNINSPWLSKNIILDGKITTIEEWSDAICLDLTMDQPREAPATLSSRWWFKNDAQWLYLLVRVPTVASFGDSAYIDYFWEHSDLSGIDLDGHSFDSYGYNDPNWSDDILASPPGENNVKGGASGDTTYRWFEFKKALNSGDGYDWNWAPGQTVGKSQTRLFVGIYDSTRGTYFEKSIQLYLGAP
jgi:TIR domain